MSIGRPSVDIVQSPLGARTLHNNSRRANVGIGARTAESTRSLNPPLTPPKRGARSPRDCVDRWGVYTAVVVTTETGSLRWYASGDEVFAAMLEAIEAARERVLLESYIFADGQLALRFGAALQAATLRGVKVRVLVDAFGSMELPDSFWDPLRRTGIEVKIFNPLTLGRLGIRNHRKLLVCDGRTAFIGGFNIADEYLGDGVTRGWCDIGVRVGGTLAVQLEASFDHLYGQADLRQRPFIRLRKTDAKRALVGATEQLLLSGPGRGANPFQRSLRRDLKRAAQTAASKHSTPTVRLVVAYFLPTWRLRRDLQRVARFGGRVQLILAGKSDVVLSQLAARSLYRRLLRAGVEIYEYQPQVLHAKLYLVDDAVYVGSANLDPRSLQLNYELMARLEGSGPRAQADELFEGMLAQAQPITSDEWRKSRTWWTRWKGRFANFLLARVDPYLSLRQWYALPD
jgi:cardiolipin synthase